MADTEEESVAEILIKLTSTIVASGAVFVGSSAGSIDDVADIAWFDGFLEDTKVTFVDIVESFRSSLQDVSKIVDITICSYKTLSI